MSEEKKPVATVGMSRATAQEEMVQVSVNVFEVSTEAIYAAITAAGEALIKRLEDNNKKLAIIRDPIPGMKSVKR